MVTAVPDSVTTFQFELVVSTWKEPVACEMTTAGGAQQCKRPAKWRVDAHGCERHLMCTGHLKSYERRVMAAFTPGGHTTCTLCNDRFTSPAAVFKAVPL